MDEKKLIALTDDIVEAIVDISMGKGKMKAVIPGSVTKKLVKDEALFMRLKECYINYLSEVDSQIDERDELKRLSDFRFDLETIYNGGCTKDDEITDEETTDDLTENE